MMLPWCQVLIVVWVVEHQRVVSAVLPCSIYFVYSCYLSSFFEGFIFYYTVIMVLAGMDIVYWDKRTTNLDNSYLATAKFMADT